MNGNFRDFDGLYNDELGLLMENGMVSVEDIEYELDYRFSHGGESDSDILSGYSDEELKWGIDWIADSL